MKYKCKNCGHDGFIVGEIILHKATSVDNKIKTFGVQTTSILSIECRKCFKKLTNWKDEDIIFE